MLEANGDDDLRHFYYNENWQCLVEAVDSGSGPVGDTLYSYHPQYIDAVATRMRASDGHYYCHDANFNVTALMSINESAKPVVERYRYTPYGEVTVLNGHATYDPDGSTYAEWSADPDNQSDIDNEFLYTGRRLDPETGLQYSRFRYYHPQLGRFINRDPIGYLGGLNLYEYVYSMPTRFTDALGLVTTAERVLKRKECLESCDRRYSGRNRAGCRRNCLNKYDLTPFTVSVDQNEFSGSQRIKGSFEASIHVRDEEWANECCDSFQWIQVAKWDPPRSKPIDIHIPNQGSAIFYDNPEYTPPVVDHGEFEAWQGSAPYYTVEPIVHWWSGDILFRDYPTIYGYDETYFSEKLGGNDYPATYTWVVCAMCRKKGQADRYIRCFEWHVSITRPGNDPPQLQFGHKPISKPPQWWFDAIKDEYPNYLQPKPFVLD